MRFFDQLDRVAAAAALERDQSEQMERVGVGRLCPEHLPIRAFRLGQSSRLMMF
jgi:hypothetical protein